VETGGTGDFSIEFDPDFYCTLLRDTFLIVSEQRRLERQMTRGHPVNETEVGEQDWLEENVNQVLTCR
jgi:hypothetical protein